MGLYISRVLSRVVTAPLRASASWDRWGAGRGVIQTLTSLIWNRVVMKEHKDEKLNETENTGVTEDTFANSDTDVGVLSFYTEIVGKEVAGQRFNTEIQKNVITKPECTSFGATCIETG